MSRFPAQIRIAGTVYVRARLRAPRRGVVAQYREPVPLESRHLLVHADGRYSVHVDRYNPDFGWAQAYRHFVCDVVGGGMA